MNEDTLKDAVRQGIRRETEGLADALGGLVEKLVQGQAEPREFEHRFREVVQGFAGQLLKRALEQADEPMRARVRQQGHRTQEGDRCRGRLRSKGVKGVMLLTLLGPVEVQRFTSACERCGRWVGSTEEVLRTTPEHLTPACAGVAALAATEVSYERAQRHLAVLAGLELDKNRIHRLVQRVGPSATRLLRSDPEVLRAPERLLPPPGQTLYVGVDGGRIRLRGGDWIEPCLGLVWWEREKGGLRRWAFAEVRDKGKVLAVLDRWLAEYRRHRRGRPVILGDGAPWIWNWAADRHPEAIWILDHYHMKEHVWMAARILYGEGTPEAARWVEGILDRIWKNQIRAAIVDLDRLRLPGRMTTAQRKARLDLVGYLWSYRGLMDYRAHRDAGRTIGSGPVESMCKQLFSMRLKGPGMFWSERGAQNIMHLRAVNLVDRWNELWGEIHRFGLAQPEKIPA